MCWGNFGQLWCGLKYWNILVLRYKWSDFENFGGLDTIFVGF